MADHADSEMEVTDALLFDDHLVVALAHRKRAEGSFVRVARR